MRFRKDQSQNDVRDCAMIDKKLTHLYAKKKRTKKPSPDRESSFGATKCKFELIGKDAQIVMYHLELVDPVVTGTKFGGSDRIPHLSTWNIHSRLFTTSRVYFEPTQ